MSKDLNLLFEKAFKKASDTSMKFPPDTLLKLYAYYKQATNGDGFTFNANSDDNLRDAFKFNAWMQLKGMTEDNAKQEYINLVNSIIK